MKVPFTIVPINKSVAIVKGKMPLAAPTNSGMNSVVKKVPLRNRSGTIISKEARIAVDCVLRKLVRKRPIVINVKEIIERIKKSSNIPKKISNKVAEGPFIGTPKKTTAMKTIIVATIMAKII